MNLFQPNKGYRYNSDTLLLYDFIASFQPKGALLDVGCGCGILGLLLKRDFSSLHVSFIDLQEHNRSLCLKNAKHNDIEIGDVVCGDFLATPFEKKFDFIVSNPPFYHKGAVKSDDTSLSMSRHSSYLPFEKFAQQVTKILSNKGYFIFCYDAKQFDLVTYALGENGLKIEDICFVHPKEGKEASLVLVRARKNSKTQCIIHSPLFVFQEGEFSPKVKAIFDKSQTKSLSWSI